MSVEAFSGKAAAYAAARPGYPEQAVDYLLSLIAYEHNNNASHVIADIGAGTGKLTVLLAEATEPYAQMDEEDLSERPETADLRAWKNHKIYGIEPNDDMRAELQQALAPYPNATAIVGTAENTGVPGHSVDLVVCAQALHWFDAEKFWAECRRIAKPGAVIAVVYNNMEGGRGGLHRKVAVDSFFTKPTIKEFNQPISYDRQSWRNYMLSHSHSPLPTDDSYQEYLSEIDSIFDKEQVDGTLTRTVTTTVYSQPILAVEETGGRFETTDDLTNSAGGFDGPQPTATKGRVLRPRHWGFIILTALVALAELVFVFRGGHDSAIVPGLNGSGAQSNQVEIPFSNDASDEEILTAFNQICDTPAQATPDYNDKFTASYACLVNGEWLWISIDLGNGDAIRYISLTPCFEGLEPTNTISGGRWMVDGDGQPIPDEVVARFPAEASVWYCPPSEDSTIK